MRSGPRENRRDPYVPPTQDELDSIWDRRERREPRVSHSDGGLHDSSPLPWRNTIRFDLDEFNQMDVLIERIIDRNDVDHYVLQVRGTGSWVRPILIESTASNVIRVSMGRIEKGHQAI